MTEDELGSLHNLFPGWLPHDVERKTYFEQAMITLDANVLLALYRITPKARDQLLSLLRRVRERLWISHQAALEFARNRQRVIADRNARFSEVNRLLQSASEKAATEIYAAVDGLKALRSSVVASREWREGNHRLSHDEIKQAVQAMLQPAVDEFRRLQRDQDLSHKDVQGDGDPVLQDLDGLLEGRIGSGYSPAELQAVIDEALSFRFPNQIPPGYLDLKDKPPARAAGDFVLWKQLIDKARLSRDAEKMTILVTLDVKPDWWLLGRDGKPEAPRPELVQEIYEEAGAKLLLLTLDEFLEGSRVHLSEDVSPETVEEARDVVEERETLRQVDALPPLHATRAPVRLTGAYLREMAKKAAFVASQLKSERVSWVERAEDFSRKRLVAEEGGVIAQLLDEAIELQQREIDDLDSQISEYEEMSMVFKDYAMRGSGAKLSVSSSTIQRLNDDYRSYAGTDT